MELVADSSLVEIIAQRADVGLALKAALLMRADQRAEALRRAARLGIERGYEGEKLRRALIELADRQLLAEYIVSRLGGESTAAGFGSSLVGIFAELGGACFEETLSLARRTLPDAPARLDAVLSLLRVEPEMKGLRVYLLQICRGARED